MILLIIFHLFFLKNLYATASQTSSFHPKKRLKNYIKGDFGNVKPYNDSLNPNKVIDSQASTDVRYKPYEKSSFESKKLFLNGYIEEDYSKSEESYFVKLSQFIQEIRDIHSNYTCKPDNLVTFYENWLNRISQYEEFRKKSIDQLGESSFKKHDVCMQENVHRNDSFPCNLESHIIEAENPQNVNQSQNSETQLDANFSITNDRSKTFQKRDLYHSDLNRQLFYDKSDEINIEEDEYINYIEKTDLINRNKFKDSKNLTMKRDSEVIQANNEVLEDINAQKIISINDKPTGYGKNRPENPKLTSMCEMNKVNVSETVNKANSEILCQHLIVSTPSTITIENKIPNNYNCDEDSAFEKDIKEIMNEENDLKKKHTELQNKRTKLLSDFGTVFKINIGELVFQSDIKGKSIINHKFYIVNIFLDSIQNNDDMEFLCLNKNKIHICDRENRLQFRSEKDNNFYIIKNIDANIFHIFEKDSCGNKTVFFEFDLNGRKLVTKLLLKLERKRFLSDLLPEYNICKAGKKIYSYFKNGHKRIFLNTCLMNKHVQWIQIMEDILEMDYNCDCLNVNDLLFFQQYLQNLLRKFIFEGLNFFLKEEKLAYLKKEYKIT